MSTVAQFFAVSNYFSYLWEILTLKTKTEVYMFKHEKMFRDAFNKVQETGSNRDFGTTKAAKMYFSLSNPGPNTFATGEAHAPSFR